VLKAEGGRTRRDVPQTGTVFSDPKSNGSPEGRRSDAEQMFD